MFASLWNRLRALSAREAEARDLDEEMAFHRELLERDAAHRGIDPVEARYRARRQLGNATWFREESKDMWRIQPIENIAQDIRYALRFLRRSPAFTSVAILSLALGIGANTAIFSLINAISVRPLPVADPGSLVLLEPVRFENVQSVFSYPYFKALDTTNTVLDGLFAMSRMSGISIDRGNGPEQLANGATLVSGGYFPTLGIRPAVGRLLNRDDDRIVNGHQVVVLSYDLWQQAFGGDMAVVGRSLRVNGTSLTIVGVTPAGFSGMQAGERSDLYLPLMMAGVATRGDATMLEERGDWWLYVMGRRKAGVTNERAASELSVLFKREILANPPFARTNTEGMAQLDYAAVRVTGARSGLATLRRQFEKPLLLLAGMAAIVLLVACINLASLLSARAAARRREVAIRLSMGAGRQRLLRQLLTESLLLAVGGAALGVTLAYGGAEGLLLAASRGRVPMTLEIRPDWRVLIFTLALMLATSILFGLVPALQATKLQLASTLRAGGSAGRGRGSIRLGKVLIGSQVAFSVLLVFAASLFVRSLQRLHATDLGFNQRSAIAVRADPRRSGYRGSALRGFYDQLLARARTMPGARAATLTTHVPFSGSQSGFRAKIDGFTPSPGNHADITRVVIGDDYFRTTGIPLRSGRLLTADDIGDGSGPRFAVVNESFVRTFVPGGSPLGKRFYRGPNDSTGVTIVGVVADVRFNDYREPTPPIAYWQYASDTTFGGPPLSLFVRVDPNLQNVTQSIRSLYASIDRNVEVLGVRQLEAMIDATISNERMVASLSGFFGGFALVLAMIGLYGLMAYAVTSRTRELGIRIALGAESKRVARSVVMEAMTVVFIGIAVGLPLALAAAKVGRALLFGLQPSDAPTLAITVALLAVVAVIAVALPAWRASRIDPVTMLRTE
jgi:predicted permease